MLGDLVVTRLRVWASLPIAVLLSSGTALGQAPPAVQIVLQNGYPELHVDAKPFFVHAAAFAYFRIPRDLWARSLDRYRELGINTIDLPIPWNWHEPRKGEFDFDGHTNPRRDLRGLLKLVAEKGFKLCVRAGPILANNGADAWPHGGYPEWLLAQPEYGMTAAARAEGAYPAAAELGARDAEAGAHAWMENPAHMAAVEKWLAALGQELAPYSANRKMTVSGVSEKTSEPVQKEIGGPLLFVQLDDSPGFAPAARAGAAFWDYVGRLRRMLESGGVRAVFTINPAALPAGALASPDGTGLTGQWYLRPDASPPHAASSEEESGAPDLGQTLAAADASSLQLLAESLATQAGFPPMLSDFQAGWHAPGDDARPPASAPANTLLASRLLFAHGVRGIEYSPLQDTLTPVGYELPGRNRYERWDAALDLAGNQQPRARGVARNGDVLALWGGFLAASHKRADFGLLDLRAAFAAGGRTAKEVRKPSPVLLQVERMTQLAGFTSELLDPEGQPLERLLLDPVLLLPVGDSAEQRLELSEKAQEKIVEYVRRGGTLVYFPARPAGKTLEQLWAPAPAADSSADGRAPAWAFGRGRVIKWSKDFYSWVVPREGFAESRARFEASLSIENLRQLAFQSGVRVAVERKGGDLIVSQLVSDEGTGPLGARRTDCGRSSFCGRGLLSVTNLNFYEPAENQLSILSPKAGARETEERIALNVQIPARESLLLPLHYPLCSELGSGQACDDEITAAGAELVGVTRENKDLLLAFYAPTRATLLLHLESVPAKIMLEEMNLEGQWAPETRLLEVALPRGASPEFLRVVKVRLRYTPHVPEKPKPPKKRGDNFEVSIADALRLPLGDDASLPSEPPLILLNKDRNGHVLVRADNRDESGRDITVKIEGAAQGSARMTLGGEEAHISKLNLEAARGSDPETGRPRAENNGLLRGGMRIHSRGEDRTAPVVFAVVGEDVPAQYRFDFDRDGAEEWALENERLRLIVSPEAGGRIVALVDKATGTNLTTTAGMLRDLFPGSGPATNGSPAGSPGNAVELLDVAFNRTVHTEWLEKAKDDAAGPGLQLSYEARKAAAGGALEAGTRMEKRIRLAGNDSVEVDYRLTSAAESFVSVTSVPAHGRGDRGTEFCWTEAAAEAGPNSSRKEGEAAASAPPHCEEFAPERGRIAVPESVRRVEIITPGRPGLAVEWKTGALAIEMKRFSVLLELRIPAAVGEQERATVRYTLLPEP